MSILNSVFSIGPFPNSQAGYPIYQQCQIFLFDDHYLTIEDLTAILCEAKRFFENTEIATGVIDLERLWRVIFKEIRVALVMGGTCGALVCLVAFLWQGKMVLGLVVGCAMMTAIFVANVMGTLIPVFFKKLKIDPAVASGPIVTTSNDVTGILIYLGIATISLKHLL